MWRKLWFTDEVETAIRAILRSGIAEIKHSTGLITPRGNAIRFDTNWLFCGNTVASRDCYLWHEIMFNYFNLVPSFCRFNCYKVVVHVRNFREAHQFFNLLNASACINADCCNIHGKCGIDSRPYSNGAFNGFVYCDGLDDGLEKYKVIRALVSDHIEDGENIPIVLKRSCTEFERKFGSTDNEFWNTYSEKDADFQKRLEDIFVGHWLSSVQPDWLKNKVILTWAKWANSYGDKSWIDYFNEDFLTMKAVTYHELSNVKKGGVDEEEVKPSVDSHLDMNNT